MIGNGLKAFKFFTGNFGCVYRSPKVRGSAEAVQKCIVFLPKHSFHPVKEGLGKKLDFIVIAHSVLPFFENGV